MNGLDILLIITLLVFLIVGARLGSLWTAACLIGGFLGAVLVDYYTPSVADLLGGFAGSHLIAAILLFSAGAAVALLPGLLLSRIVAGIFLGVVDGAFGLATGLLAGLLAITLFLLAIPPMFPRVEASSGWKSSKIVRPLHDRLETVFNAPRFRPRVFGERLENEAERALEPLVERAKETAQDVGREAKEKVGDIAHDVRKKMKK